MVYLLHTGHGSSTCPYSNAGAAPTGKAMLIEFAIAASSDRARPSEASDTKVPLQGTKETVPLSSSALAPTTGTVFAAPNDTPQSCTRVLGNSDPESWTVGPREGLVRENSWIIRGFVVDEQKAASLVRIEPPLPKDVQRCESVRADEQDAVLAVSQRSCPRSLCPGIARTRRDGFKKVHCVGARGLSNERHRLYCRLAVPNAANVDR